MSHQTSRTLATIFWLSAAAAAAIAILHRAQPGWFAAVTAIPPWLWFTVIVPTGLLAIRRTNAHARLIWGVVVVVVSAGLAVEQLKNITRSLWYPLANGNTMAAVSTIRVVTANCAGGSVAAARDAVEQSADILLLQESPTESAVRELAESHFGQAAVVVWTPDCSIIARGELIRSTSDARRFAMATVRTPSGEAIDIASLRLSPPVVRYDLWNPRCWREHLEGRRLHRAEADEIIQAFQTMVNDRPAIFGGDCNVPAGDGAIRGWQNSFRDAFDSAGIGWGNTVLNRMPFLRFDQIWHNDRVRPLAVWAVKAKHSDHRIVVADFELRSR